jgi:peptidoglycan/LPS O-acetylase OafA/YrhL
MLAERVRRRPLRYRPHLDGLRTIAVYAVLAFHAGLGGFAGGFIGVDVFFVLSGFLVTSILIRDLAASSHVDYRRFYAGRVRRILPAAIITLCVSAIAYAVVATPSEMLDVVGGFRASCLYVANWFFIRQSTNYFASNVNASPVLHFWSLAVEEQFYLLWPLLLGGLYAATARARRWRWWLLRGLVAAAVVASAVEAWRIAGSNLERAYYGTDTRAYQLLAGALLALTPQLMHASARAKRALPALMTVLLAGLVVVASSALDIGPITRGLFATGLAALLIVALEASGEGFVKKLLSSGPAAYLGRLSYGIYLWHWPVIVIAVHGRHIAPAALFVMTCAISTGLAALSFHFVEHPLRTSQIVDRYKRLTVGVGIVVSIAVGLAFLPAVLDRSQSADAAASGNSLDWRAAKNDIAKLPNCLGKAVDRCTVVRGTKQRVLLIGDSHAQMWLPALESIARRESLTLSVAVLDACPWQRGMFYLGSGSVYTDCKRHQADWYNRIVPAFNPDIVVLAQSGSGSPGFPIPFTFPDGRKLAIGQPGYDDALIRASAATIEALRAQHRRVVIFEPIPATFPFDPLSCLSRGGPAAACARTVDARPTPLERYFRRAALEPKVASIDLDRVVCPRLPTCDAALGGIIVRRDANGHLTAAFARSVAPAVERLLQAQSVLRSP